MGRKQRARARRAKIRETKPATIPAFIALQEADLTYADRTDRVRDEILEMLGGEQDDRWIWIRDLTDTWVVYEDEGAGSPTPGCFRVAYTIDDTGECTVTGPAVPVEAQTIYVPAADEPAPVTLTIAPEEAARHLVGDTILLSEKALRRDGTVQVKVIEEGWGSSGYYGADMLQKFGPKAFPAGTHMFWNHPTATEEADRPERDLSALAASTVSDAYWLESGASGAGLYADAEVFGGYRDALEELAPHIGVSIRAEGVPRFGEAEGRKGVIVDEITEGRSIDFVTTAGAGGEVISLFESARGRRPSPVPVPKESAVDLQEALASNTKLTTDLTEATALGTLAASERDRFREAVVLRDARDLCAFALAEAKYANVPDITKARVLREASANPPVTADGTLDVTALGARFDESVKGELEYLATTGGRGSGAVTGLGGDTLAESEVDAALVGALEGNLGRLGLSESGAKVGAAGRR